MADSFCYLPSDKIIIKILKIKFMRKFIIISIFALLILPFSSLATQTDPIPLDPSLDPGQLSGVVIGIPIASPVAGTYSSTQSVTLTTSGSSGICYTTSGTDPVCAASGASCTTGTFSHSPTISVSSSVTIEAISCYPDNHHSSVGSYAYTISVSRSSGGGYTPITTTTTTTTTKPISQMTPAEVRVEITRLAALVVLLQAQLKEMMGGPSAISSIPESFKFTKNLQFGQVLIDVKYLQIVLNSDSATMVASIGPGSPGNETNYFGVLTKAAVIKFQVKYKAEILTPLGLTAGTGYVGPSTIKKLNELLK